MIRIEDLNTPFYRISHLLDYDLDSLKAFRITNPKGKGLEVFLKETAEAYEEDGISRTYIISDTKEDMPVAYFTLQTGLITVSRGLFKGFDVITGIELTNFAVNDAYREAQDVIPKLGAYLFVTFILPLVREISKYVGAKVLYIYALPENKLMGHYQTIGFQMFPSKQAKYVYRHVKPFYDQSCIFMWQPIS